MTAPTADISTVALAGRQLTVAQWGAAPAEIVLLHDGLGSIAQWRDVPARIARRTGAGVIAYDRAGHGSSLPVPAGPWPADWLHTEAGVLGDLLEQLGIAEPLLVGHSDGGSIALLRATVAPCAAVVAIAAHSFVEQVCTDAIAAMRAHPSSIVSGLARAHHAPEAVFEAWSGAWTSEAFRSWDIRPQLAAITCPTLVVQGDADEYATTAQLTSTVEAVGDNGRALWLEGVGHVVHRQAPDLVVDIVGDVHSQLLDTKT